MRAAIRVLLAALCLATLWGCSNDATAPEDRIPPALPQVSTMKPTLNFYGVAIPTVDPQTLATGKAGDALLLDQTGDHSNFVNGVVRAFLLMFGAYDVLNEPIGAWAVAANSLPTALDDDSYLWTYIFIDPDTGFEYSVFVYGNTHDGGPHDAYVDWRMEVSSNDPAQPLDHFVWLTGESLRDHTACFWQFYSPVNATDGVESVHVDWNLLDGKETRLVLTVNGAGLPNEGDVLTFNDNNPESSIEYYDASEDYLSTVVWRTNGSGSLHVPDYNGGATACWDQHQINTTCK